MITLFKMKEKKNIQEKKERERERKQCNNFQSANVER